MSDILPTEQGGGEEKSIEVLVMGDWVVDENWVLARHRSTFSTVEGKAHLRALGDTSSGLMTFCGAGRVARFLYWMNRFENPEPPGQGLAGRRDGNTGWIPIASRGGRPHFSVFGLGTWAVEDEDKLYQMFHPSYPNGINPFTLSHKSGFIPRQELDGLYLRTLASAYPENSKDADGTAEKRVGTTRVYRLYNLQAESPGGLVLDRRVDFQLRFSSRDESGGRRYNDKRLRESLEGLNSPSSDPASIGREAWAQHINSHIDNLEERLFQESGEETWDEAKQVFVKLKSLIAAELGRQAPAAGGAAKATRVAGRRVFRYVLVKDLGKGTVTPSLIQALHKVGLIDEDTQWFVSSKRPRPPYLEELGDGGPYGSIRLLLLPPMAIAQMERDNGFTYKWFAGGQEPTLDALKNIEDFHGKYRPPQSVNKKGPRPRVVIAMPKGLSVLALENTGSKRVGYYQPKTILNEVDESLTGRASMFFASLSAQMICADHEGRRKRRKGKTPAPDKAAATREEMFEIALKASYDIVKGNINALRNFGTERPQDKAAKLFSYNTSFEDYRRGADEQGASRRPPLDIRVSPFNWEQVKSRWVKSQAGAGIIPSRVARGGYRLELWRAMSELDGYMELIEARRREIAKLIARLKEFTSEPPANSFSAMLIAMPGSGKSYLVSKIAEALGTPLLSFNVTQLVTRQNVNACFDVIASAQAQDRNRTHLVFFDEINAKIENSNVYDLFLTVLEDGTYLRGGQLFKLDPCAWLFAGTKELEPLDGGPVSQELMSSKEPDFKSRLSISGVNINAKGNEAEVKRSFVYQGALQLQQQNTDVKKVSAKVLAAFYCLGPETSNRSIKQLARGFQNIQYGEVRFENSPKELRERLDKHAGGVDWMQRFVEEAAGATDLDDVLVEIKREPDDPD